MSDILKLRSGAFPPQNRAVWARSFGPQLTDEQLDRLRRCANGNTLRFESATIVEALVAGGYAREGVGRVCTVTLKGYRYLKVHADSHG